MNVGQAITAALQEQRDHDLAWLVAWSRLRVRVVHVEWHRVSDVLTDIWCVACALPSAVEFDAVLVAVQTLTVIRRATFTACLDCHRAAITHHKETS